MDISSLLSPCVDRSPSQPQAQASGSSVTVSSQPAMTTGKHHLTHSTQQITMMTATRENCSKSRGQATPKAPSVPLKTAKTAKKKPPVKRKQKRNLTAKQLQVKSQNQQDESQLYNLTLDINDLKQQVRNYMVHKSIVETRSLVARQRFNAGVLRTTRHFFEVFRVGYREWEPQEAEFFASTLDPDVALGSIITGDVTFFEQWKRYKKMLQQKYFSVSSIQILMSDADSCVVECRGEFEGKLTLAAIKALFPHILQDTELLSKVVNCRLVCPTHTLIYFDASGRIVQYDAHADMFEGLNRILAVNPLDVITLMSSARISSEGSMIPDGEVNYEDEARGIDYDRVRAVEEAEEPVPGSPASDASASSSRQTSIEYILS